MLGLFRRTARSVARPKSLRPRLFLERLETRDCPSTLTLAVSYGTQKTITLSGHLSDNGPLAGKTVNFSGAATGSATTDGNGDYSLTLSANSLGTVRAYTSDGQSNIPSITLTSNTPVIQNFGWVEMPNHWFTFTGKVIDESPGGLVVQFGGAPESMQNKSVTVAADGTFSFTIQLDGTINDNGTVSAVVTDWWGLTSAAAYCVVRQTGV
jgi:hypothetical protein